MHAKSGKTNQMQNKPGPISKDTLWQHVQITLRTLQPLAWAMEQMQCNIKEIYQKHWSTW
eukprot:973853-Ditylum_brightwellii.AAC.1